MDVHGVCRVGRAYIAHRLAGCVFCPSLAVGVLRVVSDLVVGVLGIPGVVEDQDIPALCRYHQTLLVCIGHIAGYHLERLGNNSLAVVINDPIRNGFTVKHVSTCFGVDVPDCVGNCFFLNVLKGDDQIGRVDVQQQGLGLDSGETALLIISIQVGAALGVKGLGRTGKTRAGDVIRHLDTMIVLQHELNGVLLQSVGRPLAVYVEVLAYLHVGKVESLLHAVLLVEPADKGVAAVFRLCNIAQLAAVGDGLSAMGGQKLIFLIGCFVKRELDCMSIGHPLCIEHHVRSRHGHLAQVCLGACIAAGCSVPSGKCIGVFFQLRRVVRFKIVTFQRCLILHTAALARNKTVVIVEAQVIAISGVAEVVVIIDSACSSPLLHLTERRVRPPLSKARNIMEFLSIGEISRLPNVDLFV